MELAVSCDRLHIAAVVDSIGTAALFFFFAEILRAARAIDKHLAGFWQVVFNLVALAVPPFMSEASREFAWIVGSKETGMAGSHRWPESLARLNNLSVWAAN